MAQDGPVSPPTVPPAPSGRTARRLEWQHLPPPVRALVEQHCGSPVTDAVSQTAGFTPGFASVLTCADGSRHFVKAASWKAQKPFATAYREEARKVSALPAGVAAPRLRWQHDDQEWIVLGFEHVAARAPRRPWSEADLALCLDMLATTAAQLTPAPSGLEATAFAEDFADWPQCWEHALSTYVLPHGEEAAALAARFAEVTAGTTLVHTDVRDDNFLITPDGRALLCDWNWPVVGAGWIDSLLLLIGPRGDGLDVEGRPWPPTRRSPRSRPRRSTSCSRSSSATSSSSADDPVPPTSPFLRDHQLWQGEVCWEWLCERRGWES